MNHISIIFPRWDIMQKPPLSQVLEFKYFIIIQVKSQRQYYNLWKILDLIYYIFVIGSAAADIIGIS